MSKKTRLRDKNLDVNLTEKREKYILKLLKNNILFLNISFHSV